MELDMKNFYQEEFGNIRIIVCDNKILFCGNDVVNCLDYKNQKYALIRFCRSVEKLDTTTESGIQSMTFITESDVYRLIAHSELPQAKKFETWVVNKVLPTIRRTGSYVNPSYQIEDSIARAEAWIEEEKQRRLLAEENIQLSNVIAEQKPKIEYFDIILQSPKALSITVIAQDYSMTCQQMNNILKKIDIQYNCSGSWILKSQYQGRGYTDSETKNHENNQAFVHTKWTQKGRLFLYEKLKNAGYLPTIEQ